MTQPDEPSATLTDDEIRTHRFDEATASSADDADDTGDAADDTGDVSDATDTGDDTGDVTDTGDDAGDDS